MNEEYPQGREWRCSDCGAAYPEGHRAKTCEKCGAPLRRLLVQAVMEEPDPPNAA